MEVVYIDRGIRDASISPSVYNCDADLHLTVGARHRVCAMSLYADTVMVLICDDTGLPNWYPIEVFRVVDSEIPAGWHFASYCESTHLQAIWGYHELVQNDSHYDALLERDPDALETFYLRCESSA